MNEQKLQANMLKLLQSRGAYTVKVIAASKAGVPDILTCYKGLFIGLEVKVGTNKASALQNANLGLIRAAGGSAKIVRSVEEVSDLLNLLDKGDVS